jgi:alkanesulfonate monooxygenase SsuD/methylene tetrahydromethanopterin reductase-like flavin-dependent oxidoreductase (luciferase family)
VLETMMDSYDISQHAKKREGSSGADDAFIDSYAVIGAPESCVSRLRALHAIGVDRFMVTSTTPDTPDFVRVRRSVVEQVLPGLR